MLKFIAFRLLQFPLILAIIYLLTFALAWAAPGSPFVNERKLDPQVEKELKRQFHAEHAWEFLAYYGWQIVRHGDFGPSMNYPERSVNQLIGEALPVSLTLGLFEA